MCTVHMSLGGVFALVSFVYNYNLIIDYNLLHTTTSMDATNGETMTIVHACNLDNSN